MRPTRHASYATRLSLDQLLKPCSSTDEDLLAISEFKSSRLSAIREIGPRILDRHMVDTPRDLYAEIRRRGSLPLVPVGDRLDDVGNGLFNVGGLQRPRAASIMWRTRVASLEYEGNRTAPLKHCAALSTRSSSHRKKASSTSSCRASWR